MDRKDRIATTDTATVSEARAELLRWFERGGYIRRYDPDRRAREGQGYKKGYEVRFVLASEEDLPVVRRLLTAAKLRPGKPFRKHQRYVQPVYGRAAVEWFVDRVSKDRERARYEFGPDGRRLIRRSPIPGQGSARERLPNRTLRSPDRRKRRGGKRNAAKKGPPLSAGGLQR